MYFGGRMIGSRPRIVEERLHSGSSPSHESRGQAPASLTRTWSAWEEGRQAPDLRNEMEFWPFSKREVRLCQSVFSQRKACLCHADSEGTGGAGVASWDRDRCATAFSRQCPRIEAQSKEKLMGPWSAAWPSVCWQLRHEEASLRGKWRAPFPGFA